MTTPDWFLSEFDNVVGDLLRDMESGRYGEHRDRRAGQLWNAVVANRVSTMVDAGPEHPYEPATERPTPHQPSCPRHPEHVASFIGSDQPCTCGVESSERIWASVPTRGDDGLARMTNLRVTREAATLRAPKIECPDCGGNGEIVTTSGEQMCDTCLGTGEVVAPVPEARPDGAVPEDHPMMQPPTAEQRAAREAMPVDPNVAAQVAAVKAQTERMTARDHG